MTFKEAVESLVHGEDRVADNARKKRLTELAGVSTEDRDCLQCGRIFPHVPGRDDTCPICGTELVGSENQEKN